MPNFRYNAQLGFNLSEKTRKKIHKAMSQGWQDSLDFRKKYVMQFEKALFGDNQEKLGKFKDLELEFTGKPLTPDGVTILTETDIRSAAQAFMNGYNQEIAEQNAMKCLELPPVFGTGAAPGAGEYRHPEGTPSELWTNVRYVWEENKRVCIHDFMMFESSYNLDYETIGWWCFYDEAFAPNDPPEHIEARFGAYGEAWLSIKWEDDGQFYYVGSHDRR